MKPSIKIGNITFSSESPSTGRKESLTIEGIGIECETTLQELIQIHRDGAIAGDRILRFLKGELPDMFRNCGRAVCEVREIQNRQKLAYKEQKFMLKQRLKAQKAERKAEKEEKEPYKGPAPKAERA